MLVWESAAKKPRAIQQFVDYLEIFSRYKQSENLNAMGAVLDAHSNFSTVERAMLGAYAVL